MKKIFTLIFIITTHFLQAQGLQEIYTEGMKAYEGKNYVLFLQKMITTDSLRSNHPTILYNLGAAHALNNHSEEAIEALERSLMMNASVDFENDEDFKSLIGNEAFIALQNRINEIRKEVRTNEPAFKLSDKSLHPEGITYNPKTEKFYISSVRQRKIIEVDKKGDFSDWATGNNLWAMMGLTLDSKRNVLWACSTAATEMENYSEELVGKAKLLCFDLNTKELLKTYETKVKDVWLGDVILSPKGEVFATSSSSKHAAIFKVNEQAGTLEEYIRLKERVSLQGLCFDEKGKNLFIADYRDGLFKINLKIKEVSKLENAIKHPLKGIDGLYYHNNSLIAICNGIRPFQVVKFDLNKNETEITALSYLDKALPEMGEPTLGTIQNNTLYYIVNSPWGAYDKEKNLLVDKINEPVIYKIDLR